MIACSVKAAIVAVSIVLSISAQAVAQDPPKGPIRLVPLDLPPAAPSGPQSPPPPGPGEISETGLGELGIASIGLLDGESGLGLDLWRRTPAVRASALIAALPSRPPLPAAASLQRRLLLTAAESPDGGGVMFVRHRVERLLAMGAAADAARLLDSVPSAATDAALAQLHINALWLGDGREAACARSRQAIETHSGLYFQKAMILCRAIDGGAEQARLGLELLAEQNHQAPAFVAAIRALLGDSTLSEDSPALTDGIDLAAWLAAGGQPMAHAEDRTLHPSLWLWAIRTEGLDPQIRLGAAEAAERAGLLTAERLAVLYRTMKFSPAEIGSALDRARRDYDPQARALLFLVADRQQVPAARAETLQSILRLATGTSAYGTAARTIRPLLETIEPDSALAWFAADAALALYIGRRFERARAWLALARAAAANSDAAMVGFAALHPYVRLLQGSAEVGDGDAWRQTLEARGALAVAQLGLLAAALGEGAEIRDAAAAPAVSLVMSRGAVPAALIGLEDSVRAGRRGEALARLLIGLGEEPFGSEVLPAVVVAIDALRRLELGAEARALAVDAALLLGL